MGLPVEHDLQTMFDLAQEAIGVIEELRFFMGNAANGFERAQRLERVALPQFRQIAAVEQLEELNDEFDIANAAVARLHLAPAHPAALKRENRMRRGLARLLFDTPLDRLDFV